MTIATPHPYIATLLAGSRELPAAPLAWLNARRAAALERANALAVPTTRDEEWRYTDLTPMTRLVFRTAAGSGDAVPPTDVRPFVIPEAAARLVFVDGVFAPGLSDLPADCGITITTLAQALKQHGALMEPHLARREAAGLDVFGALNTAHLRDGVAVFAGRNAALSAPVHALFVATRKDSATYPRCLVVAESGAAVTLVEDFVALTDAAYFTDAVTEVAVGANAAVRHVRLQRESLSAFHIGHCAVSLAKDARYASHAIAFGARLSRHTLEITQQGEGAEARIDGLALISGRQLADTHTLMDHREPHGRCTQLHKTVVGGGAHAVFNGKVFVREGAQLTDSSQQSRNLLLSDKAHVDTKPQLEIFADDVKCAHGATVGQLDAEQLFYLKSRGIPDAQARSLLTYAFGAELIDRIPVRSLVERLEQHVLGATQADARKAAA